MSCSFYSLFCILFSFFYSNWILSSKYDQFFNPPSSSQILSSVWSRPMLMLSIAFFFFISFIIFFSYRISIWFFFMISLCWTPHFSHILFLISLSLLSVCSCSHLSFIETIILSSLLGNLQMPSSLGQLLESYCGFIGGWGWECLVSFVFHVPQSLALLPSHLK